MVDPTNAFAPSRSQPGFKVTISAGAVSLNGVITAVAGTTISVTANATNYVYLNLNTLQFTTGASFPTGSVYPICIAVCDNVGVSSLTDSRGDVFLNTGGSFLTDTVTPSPNNNDSNLVIERTYFRDTGAGTAQVGKNAFVSINHTTSVQTLNTIQDRSMWITHATPTGSYSCYGIEGLQIEMDINGSPTFTGSPDAEAMPLSLQMSDTHQGTPAPPTAFGAGCSRSSYFRQATAGCWNAPIAVTATYYANLSSAGGNGQAVALFKAVANDGTASATNTPMIYFYAKPNVAQRFASNFGFYSEDFGTNANDFNIFSDGSMPSSGRMILKGPVILPDYTPASASDTGVAGSIAFDQNFIYRCVATNSWKRAAIAAW